MTTAENTTDQIYSYENDGILGSDPAKIHNARDNNPQMGRVADVIYRLGEHGRVDEMIIITSLDEVEYDEETDETTVTETSYFWAEDGFEATLEDAQRLATVELSR